MAAILCIRRELGNVFLYKLIGQGRYLNRADGRRAFGAGIRGTTIPRMGVTIRLLSILSWEKYIEVVQPRGRMMPVDICQRQIVYRRQFGPSRREMRENQ